MVMQHDLGAHTGEDASTDEVDIYMKSLRDAIETKYSLLRKAFQSADADRSNSLTKAEIIDVIKHFALPIPENHIDSVFAQVDTVRTT